MKPFEELANAIILQAVKDYRKTNNKLLKKPKNEQLQEQKTEIEEFFLGEWFMALSKLDGKRLLRRLQAELKAAEGQA